MAEASSITVAPVAEPKVAEMHLLPCEIMYTGPAAVNAFFKPHHTPEASGTVSEAAFRGRELKGTRVPLADHQLNGWILKDTVQGRRRVRAGPLGARLRDVAVSLLYSQWPRTPLHLTPRQCRRWRAEAMDGCGHLC